MGPDRRTRGGPSRVKPRLRPPAGEKEAAKALVVVKELNSNVNHHILD